MAKETGKASADSLKHRREARRQRKKLLELAEMCLKVERFRGDLLNSGQMDRLRESRALALELAAERGLTHANAEDGMNKIDRVLRECGGQIYPRNFWNDNAETLLVAAIVVLALRAFFLQPFIIPTNSMYPSYSGMRHALHSEAKPPVLPVRVVRTLAFGARTRSLTSPANGEVFIPFEIAASGEARVAFRVVDGRKWGVVPTKLREYSLRVGDQMQSLRVPIDFGLEEVLMEWFFPQEEDWQIVLSAAQRRRALISDGRPGIVWLRTDKRLNRGEPLISFDILSGDAVMVDRFSYHFRAPRVGDPAVFRTGKIEGLRVGTGRQQDPYYIKRLVGRSGDELRIEEYTLMRNNAPIQGAAAFDGNAQRLGEFPGYRAIGHLAPGRSFTVPDGQFFAMGDNSANSLDSRFFGGVLESELVGRAFIIYYPFTKRWGLAK